jgi:predicted MPP superfamily phosphohydrolase
MPLPLGLVLRFLVILGIYCGLSYYLWTRLVRRPVWPRPWSKVVTALFLLLTVATPVVVVVHRFGAPVGILRLPAFLWLGWLVFSLFFFLATDLPRGLTWLVRKLRSRPAELDPSRRRLIARTLAIGGTALAAVLVGAGVQATCAGARIERVTVQLRRLPPSLDGTTVAQLSDLHIGQLIGKPEVQAMVRQVNALEPDLVVITGDLADGNPEDHGSAVALLGEIKSRHGIFFITGNHDYYSGAEPWITLLRRLGIRVLRNERVSIGEGTQSFDLAGVEDRAGAVFGHGPDLQRTLRGRDTRRELVLLAHRPRQVFEAAKLGVGLQLSGHTHGGQFMPLSFFAPLVFPVVSGLHRRGETQIYVNRGTGYVGVPLRLGVPAEITLLELRRAPAN